MRRRGPATPPGTSRGVRGPKGRGGLRTTWQVGLAIAVIAAFAIWRLFIAN